jgi:hypothetical protein
MNAGRAAAPQTGTPLLSYHVLLSLEDASGELWHAGEALSLSGWSDGAVVHGDPVPLEGGRCPPNLELDAKYVRHCQAGEAARRAEQGAGAAGGGRAVSCGMPPTQAWLRHRAALRASPGPAALPKPRFLVQVRRYEMVVRKAELHRARSNIAIAGSGPRQLVRMERESGRGAGAGRRARTAHLCAFSVPFSDWSGGGAVILTLQTCTCGFIKASSTQCAPR